MIVEPFWFKGESWPGMMVQTIMPAHTMQSCKLNASLSDIANLKPAESWNKTSSKYKNNDIKYYNIKYKI